MSVDQIAVEPLRLPEKERASLASRLLRSLPPGARDDDEGVAEALHRDAELDADARTQAHQTHDRDGGQVAQVNILTAQVLEGSLPQRALRLVQQWTELHRQELTSAGLGWRYRGIAK